MASKRPAVVKATRIAGASLVPGALDRELLARGLDHRDLARLSGCDKHTITRARRGEKNISAATLRRIIDVLAKHPVKPLAARLVGVNPPKKAA